MDRKLYFKNKQESQSQDLSQVQRAHVGIQVKCREIWGCRLELGQISSTGRQSQATERHSILNTEKRASEVKEVKVLATWVLFLEPTWWEKRTSNCPLTNTRHSGNLASKKKCIFNIICIYTHTHTHSENAPPRLENAGWWWVEYMGSGGTNP